MTDARKTKRAALATIDVARAGAEAIGRAVDRVGDWSIRAIRVLARNPAPVIAIATVILYVIARIPTEVFYAGFGLKPEDVGLDSVQVLLQGSGLILIVFIALSLAFALTALLIAIVLMVPHAIVVGWLPRKRPKENVWQSTSRTFRRVFRLAPLLIPLIAIPLAAYSFVLLATDEVRAVKNGVPVDGFLLPFSAKPVEVTWEREKQLNRPRCGLVFYLGEDEGRVALYDAARNDTYRINSKSIDLGFPVDCP